jgi:predicted nucleotidyltransferase
MIMIEKELQNKIAQTIHSKDPKAEAFLFGSRARGDHRKDSDWDILILVDAPKFTNELDDKFRKDLYDLEIENNQIISLMIYPKQYWENKLKYSPLYDNVKKEGVRL